ncbi:MAG: amidohydrolase family protein [Granulosicoccus sp.]
MSRNSQGLIVRCLNLSSIALFAALGSVSTHAAPLPISDAHLHYSHDSVELTPPERVIEIMREANLKLALVSSSDDNGTQLLVDLAPELVVPGLRPYTRRGQLNTWFKDQKNLDYVEALLGQYRYASIGEFHLYGANADLEIPRRIVELAAEYNLILHAHSDAEAVERLLAQDNDVKVLWAHAGFEEPEFVSSMLSKHDRLWVDLAFRGEVGSGGQLSAEWLALFEAHPERIMLGTDTYTPERIYYIPSHAEDARLWLSTLPEDLAENIAWKNAYELIMPVWQKNSANPESGAATVCNKAESSAFTLGDQTKVILEPDRAIEVGEAFSIMLTLCGGDLDSADVVLDATMPAHGHGMNYTPEHSVVSTEPDFMQVRVNGLRLHMPGDWQWSVTMRRNNLRTQAYEDFQLN